MGALRIESVSDPFGDPELLEAFARLAIRADAMGLLPGGIRALDVGALRALARALARAGIGSAAAAEVLGTIPPDTKRLRGAMDSLSAALEESPVPSSEWRAVSDVLDDALLASLLCVSPSSIQRYRGGERETPDEVAARLHVLALLIADVAGAYNEIGIRNWFRRKRSALGGRAPLDLLSRPWSADGSPANRVRQLARSLAGAHAT